MESSDGFTNLAVVLQFPIPPIGEMLTNNIDKLYIHLRRIYPLPAVIREGSISENLLPRR